MKLRAFLMRFLRGESSDVPVRLHALTPTVRPEEAAKLRARPVRNKTGPVLVFSSGKVTTVGPGEAIPAQAPQSVRSPTHGVMLEEQPDIYAPAKHIVIDFEDLPAA